MNTTSVKNPVTKGGKTRAVAMFTGSLIVAPLLLIIGIIMAPILIGIPIIFAAILMPFYSLYSGYASNVGKCPVCGKSFASLPIAFNCKDCKTRLLIREEKKGLIVTAF